MRLSPLAQERWFFLECEWFDRGPLTILERESGQRHTYELKSENITHASQESGAFPER